MNKISLLSVSVVFILTVFISCTKDGGSGGGNGGGNGGGGGSLDCNTVSNKAFAANVNPIIQNSCNVAGCHASGSFNGPGALTNYNEVFTNRAIIRTAIASGNMPKNGTLTAAQKNSILCWIDSGAPNN